MSKIERQSRRIPDNNLGLQHVFLPIYTFKEEKKIASGDRGAAQWQIGSGVRS